MKCSRCGRSELSRSHRKISERVITAALPVRPYRCRHCNKRQWQLLPYRKNRNRYIATGAAFFFVGILGFGVVSWMNAPVYETRPAPSTLAVNPAPVPAVPKTILMRPAAIQQIRKAESTLELTHAPLVHLWLGFRVLPRRLGPQRNYLVHSNGMRLSFPVY